MPRPKSNKESERFRKMLHAHLRRRSHSMSAQTFLAGAHLDEDMLSAFVEGRLSERESAPVVRHLVSCSSCRHITAQLLRLGTELSADESEAREPEVREEPGHIRRLLSDLASRVLPSTETEVFAYHAPADDFEQKDEAKESGEPIERTPED